MRGHDPKAALVNIPRIFQECCWTSRFPPSMYKHIVGIFLEYLQILLGDPFHICIPYFLDALQYRKTQRYSINDKKTTTNNKYTEGQTLEPRMKSSAKANEKIIRMGGSPRPPSPLLVWFNWLWPWMSFWAPRSTPQCGCYWSLSFCQFQQKCIDRRATRKARQTR